MQPLESSTNHSAEQGAQAGQGAQPLGEGTAFPCPSSKEITLKS